MFCCRVRWIGFIIQTVPILGFIISLAVSSVSHRAAYRYLCFPFWAFTPLFAAWKRRCYRCFSMPILINWIFFALFIKSRLVFKAGLNKVRQMGVISWFGLGGGGQRFGKDCIIYIAAPK